MKEGKESGTRRRFRARRLSIYDPIPIYISTPSFRKSHSELSRWLSSKEGKHPDQVQVTDGDGRVIRTENWLHDATKKTKIDTPTSTYQKNSKRDNALPLPIREPPFKRGLSIPWIDAKYIANEDDEDWAKKHKKPLTIVETSITALEKLYHHNLNTRNPTKLDNGRVWLSVADVADVLPVEEGIEVLKESGEREEVYMYWLKKRKQCRKPLLPELHREFPWSVLLDHSTCQRQTNASQLRRDSLEHPFAGSIEQRAATTSKIPLDEQLRRLIMIRQNLEVGRTLADQVRRREKLKRKRDESHFQTMHHEVSRWLSAVGKELSDGWLVDNEAVDEHASANEPTDTATGNSAQHVVTKTDEMPKRRKRRRYANGVYVSDCNIADVSIK